PPLALRRIVPGLLQPVAVAVRQPDVERLHLLAREARVERRQVEAERRPARDRAVEEVDREIARDAAVREPAARRLRLVAVAVEVGRRVGEVEAPQWDG